MSESKLKQESSGGLTGVQWLICAIAALGFAFDIYELLMLPLIARPALLELGGIRPGTPEFRATRHSGRLKSGKSIRTSRSGRSSRRHTTTGDIWP